VPIGPVELQSVITNHLDGVAGLQVGPGHDLIRTQDPERILTAALLITNGAGADFAQIIEGIGTLIFVGPGDAHLSIFNIHFDVSWRPLGWG